MKLVLSRPVSKSEDLSIANPYIYVRDALDHLSKEIEIKDIHANTVKPKMDVQIIILKIHTVGIILENEELAKKVRNAISAKKDLTIESLTYKATIQMPAIKEVSGSTYEINRYFAGYVARTPDFRDQLCDYNIVDAQVEYKQVKQASYKPTGKVTPFSNRKNEPSQIANIYRSFAQTVEAIPTLKFSLIASNIEKVVMHADTGKVSVHTAIEYPISPSKP